jgi:hypothetical protein
MNKEVEKALGFGSLVKISEYKHLMTVDGFIYADDLVSLVDNHSYGYGEVTEVWNKVDKDTIKCVYRGKPKINFELISVGDKVFYIVMQDWFVVEEIEIQDDIIYFISTHNGEEIGMNQDYIIDWKRA